MTTYVALTSEGQGWFALCFGADKQKVTDRAEQLCGDQHPIINVTHNGTDGTYTTSDIYAQTRHKNLRVVTKTDAKRKFGFDLDAPAGEEVEADDYEPLEEVK